MKNKIENLLLQAVATLKTEGVLSPGTDPTISIDRTRDPQHGDFASNLALVLAKQAQLNPRTLAEKLIAALPGDAAVTKIELAGPGFINFFIDKRSQFQIIPHILTDGPAFGFSNIGGGQKVQVEFVSANPTGPLHVGHGRGAAYGSVVADLLEAVGFKVHREYYVNDAGLQMDILATSIWLRYLEACGEALPFPAMVTGAIMSATLPGKPITRQATITVDPPNWCWKTYRWTNPKAATKNCILMP